MSNYSYNPVPPRVWSRVQNPCTYIDPDLPYQYDAYIPLTDRTVSTAQAIEEDKQLYKGNILQYKGNSAQFTKAQKYSRLSRCLGPNRRKIFATQSQTYTNPNTTGMLRVDFETYPYPNEIVGAPNNISGPFQYNVANPDGCSGNSVQDGGILVCGTFANPCSGEIYIRPNTDATICNPASASNVPGSSILCWNKKLQTWFPKPRYVMNNSTDKWPVNYKGLVSAIQLKPPVVSVINLENTIEITWTTQKNKCYPISTYNIYINGKLYKTVDYKTQQLIINKSELNDYNNITVESSSGIYIQTGKTTISYTKNNTIDNIECNCSFFNKIINNNAVISINTLLLDSNQNLLNLNSTSDILNLDTYNNIKLELETFKRTLDNNCCLIEIIDLYQNVLTSLYQAYNMKSMLLNEQTKSNLYKWAYDTIKDSAKLNQYLEELQKSFYVASVNIQSKYALLKPEYKTYIELYGMPDNLNFDPVKLLNILENNV